jgi:hypothetical protein
VPRSVSTSPAISTVGRLSSRPSSICSRSWTICSTQPTAVLDGFLSSSRPFTIAAPSAEKSLHPRSATSACTAGSSHRRASGSFKDGSTAEDGADGECELVKRRDRNLSDSANDLVFGYQHDALSALHFSVGNRASPSSSSSPSKEADACVDALGTAAGERFPTVGPIGASECTNESPFLPVHCSAPVRLTQSRQVTGGGAARRRKGPTPSTSTPEQPSPRTLLAEVPAGDGC